MSENAVTLSQLLNERLIKVPSYQRGYAWEERHITEFIEDLALMDVGDGAFRNHYTGTVVLLIGADATRSMDATGNALTEVDVVDGQQRLTTIVILLAVLADRLSPQNERLAMGIVERFVEVPLRSGDTVPKLRLAGTANDEFFRTRILSDPAVPTVPETASQARLLAARKMLTTYVERVSTEQDGLARLYEKLNQHLLFGVYIVESDAEAGVIFETVNARGKPLTELELVKNYLMFAANWIGAPRGPKLERSINSTWSEIYTELMKAELTTADREDQLLRAHWLLEVEPNVRFQGAKSVKERFSLQAHAQSPEVLADSLAQYVQSLQGAAVAFCDLVSPDRDNTFAGWTDRQRRQAQHAVRKLNSAGNPAAFRPLLIAARLDRATNPDDVIALIKLCERVAFRLYRVLNARSDTATGILARAAYRLRHGTLNLEGSTEELAAINQMFAPDARVFGALATVADSYHWWGLRYFLYEWEAHLTGAEQMAHDWGDVDLRPKKKTIEHILPQAPKGDWLEVFPDAHERGN